MEGRTCSAALDDVIRPDAPWSITENDTSVGARSVARRAPDGIDLGAFANDPAWDGALGGEPRSMVRRGRLVAGRYRLCERLARGGMGTVWSARDERLQREVAIKLMTVDPDDDQEDVRVRFAQEARAAAALSSPHVVTVFDDGVDDDTPFIVLERLEGEDLRHRVERLGALPLAVCERILTHVARGLDAAHAAGVVHRDIKPSNIFLTRGAPGSRADGMVKILDFGVAKRGASGLVTRTGTLVGTPHFMSPEQLRGAREVDRRSDLFSLAAVMYLCVVGQRAFGGDVAQAMTRIASATFTPPSRVAPDLPPELDAFFARALALAPEHRFPSAGAMARAFRRIVRAAAGEPPAPRRRDTLPGLGGRALTVPPPSPSEETVALPGEQAAGFVDVRPSQVPAGSPWAHRGDDSEAETDAGPDARSRRDLLATIGLAGVAAATLLAVVIGAVT